MPFELITMLLELMTLLLESIGLKLHEKCGDDYYYNYDDGDDHSTAVIAMQIREILFMQLIELLNMQL